MHPMAIDQFGRKIHYLRISLTDHCNLRCIYCMPEDQTFRPNAELMQDDEIALLTRLFASLGFDKIRLTGGEPTVRNHIVEIVRSIASTPGIESVSMTTNGVLLKKLAQPLAEAGLQARQRQHRHAGRREIPAPHPLGQAARTSGTASWRPNRPACSPSSSTRWWSRATTRTMWSTWPA